MRPALALIAAAMTLMFAGAARAEDRPLCADRPGKGAPPCVLDPGRWEIEVGAADFQHDRLDGVTTNAWAFGATEARLGLMPTLEAEVAWTLYARVAGGGATQAGVGDVAFSLRQSLKSPSGDGVSIALEPFVTAPTGAEGIGDGRWEGGLIAPMAFALPDGFGLGLSLQARSAANAAGDGRHLVLAAAAGLSHAVGPVTAGLELWCQADEGPAGHTTQATLDATAAFTPRAAPQLQLDAGVYLGLNRHTPDVEVAVGLARRF